MNTDTPKGFRLKGVMRPTRKMIRQSNTNELAAYAETRWADLALREDRRRTKKRVNKRAKEVAHG